MKHNKTIYLILFLSLGALKVLAQEKQREKTISEEIEVIRPYKPILAEAVKLRRSPDLEVVKTYKAKFKYFFSDYRLEQNSDIQKLPAQSIAAEQKEVLVNNYLKAGAGNLKTLLGEVYVYTGHDEALQAGTYIQYFNQSGKINKQAENTGQFSVFGKSIRENIILNGRINYQYHGLYFYGLNPDKPALNPNPEQQIFNFVELEGEVANKFKNDKSSSDYAFKTNAYLFKDKYSAKEQALTLTAYVNQRISSFNLGLAATADFGTIKDQNTNVSNNLLRLNPYIKLQVIGLKITAGANFAQEFGFKSSSRAFPAATADFTLIPDFLQVFGEIKGDVNRNALKSFSDENPFLNNNILIQNSVDEISLSAGIKGTGGPGFGYKARLYFKKITDMPLFVNNFNSFNKFDVIYDFGAMKLIGFEGEISVQISDLLKWTGKLNLEDYQSASEKRSYYKPQMRLSSNLMWAITNRFTFNASLALQDNSYAKIFLKNPQNSKGSYPAIPNFDNEKIVKISGFADFGVGANYKIDRKFSIFAKANNLLNVNYSRYLYYQVFGFNMYGGLIYSF